MDNIKVSVIIPVYNVQTYLARCLDSIINQTYSNLEIIIVDDGSTDGSAQIAQEYAMKDDRIKLISKDNGGLSSARNCGLNHANGNIISFIDSDDWLYHDAYANIVSCFNSHDVDLVMFKGKPVYGFEDKIDSAIKNIKILTQQDFADIIFGTKNRKGTISCWNKVYKTKLLEDIRFVEGVINEDIYFNYLVYKKIKNIAYIDAEYYYYFQRTDSLSSGKIVKKSMDLLKMWDVVFEQENDPNLKEIIKLNKIFGCFTLLLRSAVFGVDEQFDDFEDYKKFMLKEFRKNILKIIVFDRLDKYRKIAAILMFINYNLCGSIAKKYLKV